MELSDLFGILEFLHQLIGELPKVASVKSDKPTSLYRDLRYTLTPTWSFASVTEKSPITEPRVK